MIKCEIKEGILHLEIPIDQDPQPSKSSGKSLIIASTHGYCRTTVMHMGKEVSVNANAFIRA